MAGKRICAVNWGEYNRLKKEEGLTDQRIAKIFKIAPSTLSYLKKEKNGKGEIGDGNC